MREPINILLTPWPGYQGSKNANVSRNNLDYHGQIINKYSMSTSRLHLSSTFHLQKFEDGIFNLKLELNDAFK